MQRCDTAVIGAGASGIVAALAAAGNGGRTVLLEKTPRIARKVLASGNGRCNLLNDRLGPACYNAASRQLVSAVFTRFGKDAILRFFAGLGVTVYSDEGRIFPVTNQAVTVVRALEIALARAGIPLVTGCDVASLSRDGDRYTVTARDGRRFSAAKVVLATGGKTYPSFGSEGGGYQLARGAGHTVIPPAPVAVPLVVKHQLCHQLQGQKIRAVVRVLRAGTAVESCGDLLFAKYGLSGTAILDISRPVSISLHRHRKETVELSIDLVPFMTEAALSAELERRRGAGWHAADLFVGILPNKFGPALQNVIDITDTRRTASGLKAMRFAVTGTRGWNEADFTAGGIDTREVDRATLESKRWRGLYLCGEVLDVDGRRGGYNLAWAWASGRVAGSADEKDSQ